MHFSWVAPLLLIVLVAIQVPAVSDTGERVVILREQKSVELLDGKFTLELLKIRGYRIDVMLQGVKRKLKRGESFSPGNGKCSVTFHKISPETRIARFLTDCP